MRVKNPADPDPARPPPPFRVQVTHGGELFRVTPVGELDMATVNALDRELGALREDAVRRIVLDLGELTFMDSAGARLVRWWAAHAADDAIDLSVLEGPPVVQRAFALTQDLPPWVWAPSDGDVRVAGT